MATPQSSKKNNQLPEIQLDLMLSLYHYTYDYSIKLGEDIEEIFGIQPKINLSWRSMSFISCTINGERQIYEATREAFPSSLKKLNKFIKDLT